MKKNLIVLFLICTALIFTLTGCKRVAPDSSTDQTESILHSESKELNITVKIIGSDSITDTYEIKTTEKYLADALMDEELILEKEYRKDGMYTSFGGETANYERDGAWWCITKNGEWVNEGIDDIELQNGESYEITYTVG